MHRSIGLTQQGLSALGQLLLARPSLRVSATVVVLLLSCATEQHCRPDPHTAMQRCIMTSHDPRAAIFTGVAAGAIWAGGGGCRTTGCHTPLQCNPTSGLCEPQRCGEGFGTCPNNSACSYETYTCR